MSCQRSTRQTLAIWSLRLCAFEHCHLRPHHWGNRNRLSRKVKNAWEIAESICRIQRMRKRAKWYSTGQDPKKFESSFTSTTVTTETCHCIFQNSLRTVSFGSLFLAFSECFRVPISEYTLAETALQSAKSHGVFQQSQRDGMWLPIMNNLSMINHRYKS